MRFTRNVLKFSPLRPMLLALAASLAQAAFAQTFLQPKVIPTGNWPAAVYSADVNGDGYPDLIYVDQGATPAASTTHTLLNDGRGNFTQSSALATAGTSIVIADIDADGKPDILWLTLNTFAGSSQIIALYAPGRGDGTFAAPMTYGGTVNGEQPIALGYLVAGHFFRQTGRLTVAFEDTATPVLHIFDSPAGGVPSTPYRTLQAAGPITVADLNQDGLEDIVIQESNGTAVTYVSQGGGFDLFPSTMFSGLNGINSLLIRDVNLDGRPDLIAEGSNGHIDVFSGNGDGTFQMASIGGTGSTNPTTGNGGHLIATGDFNHDNQLDALTATPAGISVLLGQGTQYLGLKGIYNAGPGGFGGPAGAAAPTDFTLADFNHDGNLDLALDSPEGIAILYGNADGSFQTSQSFAAGFPAESVALAPFITHGTAFGIESTGPVDAVVGIGAAQAMLLYGNGDGTFHYHADLTTATDPGPSTDTAAPPGLIGTVSVVDMNLDAKPDIAIAADGPPSAIPSSGGGLVIEYGDGTGNFGAPLHLLADGPSCTQGGSSYFYGAAARTGGGVLDGEYIMGYALYARNFNNIQAYEALQIYPPDNFASSSPCVNYPHNLIAAGSFYNEQDALLQQGSHMYILLTNPYANWNIGASSDLSVDGSATTPGQLVAPQLSATFGGISPTFGFPAFPGQAVIADADGDGLNDIIVTYDNMAANHAAPSAANPNYLYLWFNSGNGKFLTSAKHPVNPVRLTPSRNYYWVAVEDINGDQIPDLILSDGYILSVQFGLGNGAFGPEQHYLAGQGINGIAVGNVRRNGVRNEDLVIANGGALLANPVANKDVLAQNPDVNTGGVTVLLNQITPLLSSTGTLTASPEPSVYGNPFSITATINTANGSPAPTGTVTFYVDGVSISTSPVTLVNGSASIPDPSLTVPVGPHALSAVYSGDGNYGAVTLPGAHVVSSGISSIVANPEPSVYGSSFTLTATAPGTGTFQFLVDTVSEGSVVTTVTTNTATVTVPGTFAVGTHSITALWTATNSNIAVRITGTHQVTIDPTTISLLLCVDNPGSLFPCGNPIGTTPLISAITFYYGQTLDGVATESASNLTGSINFYDGTTLFCSISANLTGGTNVCPTQSGYFNAGSRTVYATYTGDANNQPSTSNSLAVTVFPDPTTALITTSLSPAVVGTSITFTGIIAGNYSTPNGSVNFYDGTSLIGSAALDPTGHASFTTSTLAVGTHPITVKYAGNNNFIAITSGAIAQVITAAALPPPTGTGFTLSVSPNPVVAGAGETFPLLVTITAQSSQTPPVALSCSGLPIETTCSFVTPIIPAGGGATTLQLHISAPHDCGTTTPYFIGSTDGPASPVPYAFAGVCFGAFAIFKRRRSIAHKTASAIGCHSAAKRTNLRLGGLDLLLLLIALISLASLSGCGHCTDLGTRPGTYTFTVTATPQATSTTPAQSITLPLTVTIP